MTVRKKIPVRTCKKTFPSYKPYKPYLEKDFSERCGYCDTHDGYLGKAMFHVEHFAPSSKFKDLKTVYSNLIYSCASCNIAKSNDWPMKDKSTPSNDDVKGYVDPCSAEYDKHLYRDSSGNICHKTPLGKYMHERLKLYLAKHRVYWCIDALHERIEKIESVHASLPKTHPLKAEVGDIYLQLLKEYYAYHRKSVRNN